MEEKQSGFGMFVLKSIVFSIIFWTMWIGVIQPITSPASDSANTSSQSQATENDALMKKYWEQLRRADKMHDALEDQYKRAETLLAKKEELANRFDILLRSWERRAQ